VDPADALESLLLAAGINAQQIPSGTEARAARWRDHTAGKRILLLLDDAAGHEQVQPLLPGTAGSLVLVTSRRHLTALDAVAISLDTLADSEAAALLARLAGRSGLRSGDAAAGEIARLCGYLPLAIGMMARQLHHHPAWTAEHVAADLAAARDRLELMQVENLSVKAAFDLSYQELTSDQQRLFARLGLHPGPDIDAYAAAALDGIDLDQARRLLGDLYDQHLISEPAYGRYRLHDLLREHARGLAAAADPADSSAAAGRLLDYYLHTAAAASTHFATRTSADRAPLPGRFPGCVPLISTPGQASEWLETERPNLHAATDYAAAHALPRHAVAIPEVISGFLRAQGHWEESAALYQTALTAARQAGDKHGQASALSQLGNLRTLAGDYPGAIALNRQALAIYQGTSDRLGQARALNHLGVAQMLAGNYPAAAAAEQQALALSRDVGDRAVQADALNDLGFVQQLTGDHMAAAECQRQALALYTDLGHAWGQADALNHLGIVQRLTGDYPSAAASQQQSLTLFRDVGHLRGQADALNELGLVQQVTGDYPAAAASHQQALEWFRDLGDRRGQAEALNNLGDLLDRSSASCQALSHYGQALVIARDISAPAEEARALEGIGRCYLQNGSPGEGLDYLRQALTIYQRIGAPGTRRVQETLRHHPL
jgi:tetratricopeptide (TPR) repeat protein